MQQMNPLLGGIINPNMRFVRDQCKENLRLKNGFSPGNNNPGDGLTLKRTNASELNKVGPTTVLVLPENSQGNYDLIIESSFDLGIWTPFHSQAVQSDTARRLFRVKIVHKEGGGAAAEGVER